MEKASSAFTLVLVKNPKPINYMIPLRKKIIVSKDVLFEENKGWNWSMKDGVKGSEQVSDDEDNNDVELENELNGTDANEVTENNDVTENDETYMNQDSSEDLTMIARVR
ncbi:hypothetical protein A2U01_0045611 [Trifolium medium]|uniref:Uncharacterized protein n=1 Tax=Trifolium medium TaxID=97028 RepID=A0A392QJQ5_9FABA|nr:hypothetical protein [Trifolium medium]